MPWHLGYNTNGFAHHRLEDAIEILADLGYRGIAITLDHSHLDPFSVDANRTAERLAQKLRRLRLRSVVETGSRFLLDPRRKHWPNLMSKDDSARQRRLDFLSRCVELADILGSDAVSLWSGAIDSAEPSSILHGRLCDGIHRLLADAQRHRMPLAFEPEPGMFVDTLDAARPVFDAIDHPLFRLTIDVGHLHCQNEGPICERIAEWSDKLANVHLDDARIGVHEHLQFGEGEMEFGPIFDALDRCGYQGGCYVELSRHSHNAVEAARFAFGKIADRIEQSRPHGAACKASDLSSA